MSDDATADHPSTRVISKSSYHHGDLRAQLIAAVRELVERQGPDGFSVSEAARQAGVSSAAPYKHFKDRQELLRGAVGEAMDRLRRNMEQAYAERPAGSVEAVAGIGQAYVNFARTEPGMFRLVFGLTEGHEHDPELREKGETCFGVVVKATALHLELPSDHMEVRRRAYMLWAFVHGHSFLVIDRKTDVSKTTCDDWSYLIDVCRSILSDAAPERRLPRA